MYSRDKQKENKTSANNTVIICFLGNRNWSFNTQYMWLNVKEQIEIVLYVEKQSSLSSRLKHFATEAMFLNYAWVSKVFSADSSEPKHDNN